MNIVKLEGPDLAWFLRRVQSIDPRDIDTLRVSIDGGGVKVKVNGSEWSAPYGRQETDQ